MKHHSKIYRPLAVLAILMFGAGLPGWGPLMAQLSEPPPVHSFDLEQPAADVSDADEAALLDFYREATQIPLENTPPPSLPPGSAPLPPSDRPQVNSPPSAVAPPAAVPPPPANDQNSLSGSPGQSAAPASGPDPFADYAPSPAFPDSQPAPDPVLPLGRVPAASPPASDSSVPFGSVAEEASAGGSPGRWIQLDIGQSDGSRQAAPARPTTVPTVPLPPPAAGPAPASGGVAVTGRRDTTAEAVNQAMDQAIQQPPASPRLLESAGREQLRHLFSDMLPPESQSARALSEAGAQEAAPPPEEAAASDEPETGSSAILKAGGLLTMESQFGAAEILPPLTGKVDWRPPAAPAEDLSPAAKAGPLTPAQPAQAEKAKIPAKAAAAKPAPKTAAKSSGQGRSSAKKSGQTAARATSRSSLIIINETGQEQMGQRYGNVLGKMGYKVLSVANREPGDGARGQTVINYGPGRRAQAQAMARHLPGKKVLREVKGASQIMIRIR